MTTRVAAYPVWRAHDLFWPLENAPASLKRNPADEVYWMSWDHSFAGKAVIRVARNDGDILVTRRYWACRFGKARCRSARLTTTDWALLEDAVVAAGFWLLDEQIIFDLGCDGATWLIAGRGVVIIATLGAGVLMTALYDLGRLMFDLAGLAEVSL
jgi:hypothetical protein